VGETPGVPDMTRTIILFAILTTLTMGCTEIPSPNSNDFETPELDVELPSDVRGELKISPITAFVAPQTVLDMYHSLPGETERLSSDAFVYEGSENTEFVADGLIYEIETDHGVAEDFLTWCMLSEIRGGGDQPPDVVPVDIGTINGSYVTFNYEFGDMFSSILTCSFGTTNETVGFIATVLQVINPRVQQNGEEVSVDYSGTNAYEVDLKVYLDPNA
jgi:hypothetical protein